MIPIDPQLIVVLDRLVQWLIIPAAVLIWSHNKRLSQHDAEILKIATIIEVREHNREGERKEDRELIRDLKTTIEKLNSRLDRIVEVRQ